MKENAEKLSNDLKSLQQHTNPLTSTYDLKSVQRSEFEGEREGGLRDVTESERMDSEERKAQIDSDGEECNIREPDLPINNEIVRQNILKLRKLEAKSATRPIKKKDLRMSCDSFSSMDNLDTDEANRQDIELRDCLAADNRIKPKTFIRNRSRFMNPALFATF